MSSRTGKGPAVRSYRRRKAVLDLDLNLVPASDNREHEGPSTQSGPLGVAVEQQPPASQPTMIDVEDIDDDVVECTPGAFAESDSAKVLPEPRIEPVFNCPICMGPLAEEMSTRCGHIFCKNCIKAAISAQGKCPTCRKKITVKELIRVFLPSTS
ncbi:hypothetical protein V8G54_023097 [Vigna mungo]|uniref:RING-type domain-containing protein n=1 Tax=Vigna mungo TaxID=3915 RepID=A0AAQ3N443_VIGMU